MLFNFYALNPYVCKYFLFLEHLTLIIFMNSFISGSFSMKSVHLHVSRIFKNLGDEISYLKKYIHLSAGVRVYLLVQNKFGKYMFILY